MSATQPTNATMPGESKSAKKRKAKTEAANPSPSLPEPEIDTGPSASDAAGNGTDATYESPFVKDLAKSVHSSLLPSQKTDVVR